MEGVGMVVESSMDALRPMQLLNSLVIASLVTLYTFGREAALARLLALWAVGAGFILLWVGCVILLHNVGL